MRYLATGKIVPERVAMTIQPILVEGPVAGHIVKYRIEIILSHIYVHIEAPAELSIPDLRNDLHARIGHLVNFVGFVNVLGLGYELDALSSLDEGWNIVFGVEGFTFDDTSEFGDRLTFPRMRNSLGPDASLLACPFVARVTLELRNSVRYPDFTALHCRLVIEAMRSYFDADVEPNGWMRLRDTLNVQRSTIELFQDAAREQRHGQCSLQTWEQRRRAMQVTWEIAHRFFYWRTLKPQRHLCCPEFPLF